LVLKLRDHFQGAELVFDAFSPFHIWRSNLQVSIARIGDRFPRLHWGIWRGQDLETWGEGIRRVKTGDFVGSLDDNGVLGWWLGGCCGRYLSRCRGRYHGLSWCCSGNCSLGWCGCWRCGCRTCSQDHAGYY
jgi:hypothetical protein